MHCSLSPQFCPPKTCQQFQCHFRVNYSLNQILFKAIPTLESVCVSLLMDYHMCCITISPSNTICRSCGQSLNHHIDFHQLFGPPMSGAELRCCYFYVEIDGLSSYTSFYLFCYSNLSIWPHADTVLTTEYGMDCVFCFIFFLVFPSLLPLITGPLICSKIGMNCNESGLMFHCPLVQTWETGCLTVLWFEETYFYFLNAHSWSYDKSDLLVLHLYFIC